MKRTNSKDVIEKMKALYRINQQRKELEEAEKILKDWIKEFYPEGVTSGDFTAVVKKCVRTSIDTKQLTLDLGEKVHKYEKTTDYLTVTVLAA